MESANPRLAVLVLAAGKGTRMQSRRSKVLHEICGKPLLAYPLAAAAQLGAEKLVVVIGRDADQVEAAFAGRAAAAHCRSLGCANHELCLVVLLDGESSRPYGALHEPEDCPGPATTLPRHARFCARLKLPGLPLPAVTPDRRARNARLNPPPSESSQT